MSLPRSKEQRIKLVIFDLDGTLVDAYAAVAASVNYTLRRLGHKPILPATIKRTVGWGDRHLLETLLGKGGAELKRVLAIYRRHHRRALQNGSRLLPGSRRLLRTLRREKYKLAVASNRPTEFSHIVLKHLGIREYFACVLCGDKVKRPKPWPDILINILKRFSLRPEAALYVGDLTIDVQTGRRAGIKTVAVMTGSSRRRELLAQRPFRVVKGVYAVAGILRG